MRSRGIHHSTDSHVGRATIDGQHVIAAPRQATADFATMRTRKQKGRQDRIVCCKPSFACGTHLIPVCPPSKALQNYYWTVLERFSNVDASF
jgi:hypothetical protein